jgi:hypothetical protein
MLERVTRRVLVFATATSLGGFALGVPASAIRLPDPAGKPDLTGAWQLNLDKSDDPRKKLQGTRSGGWSDPRGGMGGGTAGGMGGVRGGFGGLGGRNRGDPDETPAMREAMGAVTEAPEKLTIVYRDADVVLTSGEGLVQTLQPNGQPVQEKTARGQETERTTKWDGSNLVTEVRMSGGVKITQTYSRSPDGQQLIVTSRFESPARVVDIRRVYDAVEKEQRA